MKVVAFWSLTSRPRARATKFLTFYLLKSFGTRILDDYLFLCLCVQNGAKDL